MANKKLKLDLGGNLDFSLTPFFYYQIKPREFKCERKNTIIFIIEFLNLNLLACNWDEKIAENVSKIRELKKV